MSNINNPITELLKVFSNPDNTFNPEMYCDGQVNGKYKGIEYSLTKKFCCGSGFIRGMVGDQKVAIFAPYNQMVQVYINDSNTVSLNVSPHTVRSSDIIPVLEQLFGC